MYTEHTATIAFLPYGRCGNNAITEVGSLYTTTPPLEPQYNEPYVHTIPTDR